MENEIVGPQKEKNRFSKAELLERVMNLVQSRKTRLEIQELHMQKVFLKKFNLC